MQSSHTRMPSLDTGCEKPGLSRFIQSDNEQCDLVSQITSRLAVLRAPRAASAGTNGYVFPISNGSINVDQISTDANTDHKF